VALPKLRPGSYHLRAVFQGNKVLTGARSASRTLDVVAVSPGGPPVTPGSPTVSPPIPAAFPNEGNTGFPPGTDLVPYAGGSEITSSNTVIDGRSLGCIRVTAPGVVIRNSRIRCSSGIAVTVGDGDFTGAPLLLEDVEIDCGNGSGTAISEANVTVRRADIHGCENGLDINQSVTVEDSYIHDLFNSAASHTDGMQFASAHKVNGAWVDGALNVVIRHNTIFGVGVDGSLGTSAIISNPSGDKNILIQGNLLAGGAYTLYCDYLAAATNYQVLDNHFSTRFSAKVGAYGPSDGCADEITSGNVYDESGAPLNLS